MSSSRVVKPLWDDHDSLSWERDRAPSRMSHKARNRPNLSQIMNNEAQNQPLCPIREPITFTRLKVSKEISLDQGISKTRNGQISAPEPEKMPIIPCRQERETGKNMFVRIRMFR